MVLSLLRLGATLALSLTAVALSPRSEPALPRAIPGSYIVEFEGPLTTTDGFLQTLASNGIEITRSLDLSFPLFQGASFSLVSHHNKGSTIKKILSLPGIKSVSPVREHSLPQQSPLTDDASVLSHGSSLKSRQFSPEVEAIHQMTGVDKLKEEGYTGTGIKIAVVDMGVDYNHPALGGCFGEGCLISFGEDLVGDGLSPMEDAKPYDDCSGHGTGVSSVIAAQENQYGFTGVAPNVTLGHYRVINCNGVGSTDLIIQAFKLAYLAGADIITSSLGAYSGWSSEPWGVVIERLTKAGVVCIVAVGNNGIAGPFFATDGAGLGVTGVGAVDSTETPMFLSKAYYSTQNGTRKTFGWGSGTGFANGTYPLYVLSNDACDTLPSNTPDLSPYMVLVKRGGCSFFEKGEYLAAAGGKNVLFYNDLAGVDDFQIGSDEIEGSGMISASMGEEFINLASNGIAVKVHMLDAESAPKLYQIEPNAFSSGFSSLSTQWGPTNELGVLPTVSAPGGYIMTAFPQKLGGYAVSSGTSLAAPYVAGCIALLLEAKGSLSPQTINTLLSTNANPNLFYDGVQVHPWLGPVAQQGAGLINIHDAVHTTTLLNISSIAFNDTEHLKASVPFSIQNTGYETVTYYIGHVGSPTFFTLPDDGSSAPSLFDQDNHIDMTPSHASLSFSPPYLTLFPGESVTVDVRVTPPQGLNAARIPIYSGYVTVNGTNGDSLSIPYLGAATNMRDAIILDTQNGENQLIGSEIGPVTTSGYTFHVPAPNSTAHGNTTLPGVNLRLSMGTTYVQIEVKSSNGRVCSNTTTYAPGEKILGSVPGFPQYYQSRLAMVPMEYYWDGSFEEGGYAPPGTYSFVVRALRIFGDPSNPEDYDVVETKRFRLRYVR